jgi:hypothetical protein
VVDCVVDLDEEAAAVRFLLGQNSESEFYGCSFIAASIQFSGTLPEYWQACSLTLHAISESFQRHVFQELRVRASLTGFASASHTLHALKEVKNSGVNADVDAYEKAEAAGCRNSGKTNNRDYEVVHAPYGTWNLSWLSVAIR